MKEIGTKEHKVTKNQLTDVAFEIQVLKEKLIKLGLLKTYKSMDETTKILGWECAEILSNEHPLTESQ